MIANHFDLKALLGHFQAMGEQRYGLVLDFDRLKKIFRPIKEGKDKLSAKHLKTISDDPAFPTWWKMPEINNSELESLSGSFQKIAPGDSKLVWRLFDILKNIEIVACVLCFIDPDQYAIFSVPVENLLNIRGRNQVEKYLNYLSELKEIGDVFEIAKIADVDHALWTLANIINSDNLRNGSVYNQFYLEYQNQPNIIKKIAAKNSLKQIWSESALYLDLASLFLVEDSILSGLIASREFEFIIKQLCQKNSVKLSYRTVNGIRWIYIPELAEELRRKKAISHDDETQATKYWELRNLLVHGAELGDQKKQDVQEMVQWLQSLSKEHNIKIRTAPRHEKP